MTDGISRRKFMTTVAATGAGLTIVPRHVLGRGFQAPSDTVNIATVGIGGMGGSNTRSLMSQNIVAVCDVDWGYAEKRFDAYKDGTQPAAERDDAEPGAVAAAASDAVEGADGRRCAAAGAGQCRQPRSALSKSSCRRFSATPITARCSTSRRTSTASSSRRRITCTRRLRWRRWISASTCTCRSRCAGRCTKRGTSRRRRRPTESRHADGQPGPLDGRRPHRLRIHHQRRDRRRPRGARLDEPSARLLAAGHSAPRADAARTPTSRSLEWPGVDARLAAAMVGNYPVPDKLAWDLFLGVAPSVDYHPIYHPFNWRGWVDWGQGALGDMGAHLIDHPVLVAEPRHADGDRNDLDAVQRRHLPGRDDDLLRVRGPRQHAGGQADVVRRRIQCRPSRRRSATRRLNGEGGILYIGTKGKMLQDTYGNNPRLLPKSLHESYGAPQAEARRASRSRNTR